MAPASWATCRSNTPSIRVESLFASLLITLACFAGSAFAADVIEHDLAFDPSDVVTHHEADGSWLSLDGLRTLDATGAPRIPVQRLRFVLPQDSRLGEARLSNAEWVEVSRLDRPLLAGEMVSSEGDAVVKQWPGISGSWKGSGTSFPDLETQIGQPARLHGYEIGQLEIYPVRIEADGRVMLLRHATLQMTTTTQESFQPVRREIAWPGREAADARDVRELVANPQSVSVYAPPAGRQPAIEEFEPGSLSKAPSPVLADEVFQGGNVEYVIVTVPSLVGEFQRLADSHTAHGLRTLVVTEDWILQNYRNGVDPQETIRNFLKVAYAQWGLQYLLLGGDAAVLPPRYVRSQYYPPGPGYTDIPCDLYFAALDGNYNKDGDGIFGEWYQSFLDVGDDQDFLAELYIGRAPVNDAAQAAIFVDKSIEYQDPTDGSHLSRGLFMSEVLFPQEWDGVTLPSLDGATYSEDIIFNSIITPGNLMESWRLYENYVPYFGSEPETKVASLDSLDTGRFGLVHHVGHGFYYNMSVANGNIVVADADALVNGPNYFLLYALNCSSAAFDFDCLLERFIQNPNGGSVISMGSCRAAFPTAANDYQQEFYDQVFVQGVNRVGQAMANSRAQFAPNFNAEGDDRWTHFTYTLLGDPALRVWRKPPLMPTVGHPGSVPVGTELITVNVSESGLPVSGARVTLHKAGESYVTGLTNSLGDLVLPLHVLSAGSIDIVVADQSLRPYVSTIGVDPPTAAHVLSSVSSLDDGGDNGLADAGETVSLGFQFTNNGNGTSAPGVTAVLNAVNAPGATITDANITVGDLAGGANATPGDVVTIDLDSSIPDGTTLVFELVSNSGADSWSQIFDLRVIAPEPQVTRLIVDDSVTGNGDGIVQNGESYELFVEVKNYGAGNINSLSGALSTASGNVTLVDASNSWSSLGLKGFSFGTGSFELIESDASVENWITLTLNDSRGHSWVHTFELRPPAQPDLPLSDTSLSPTTIALQWDSSDKTHFYGYRVYRSDNLGGPYAEITQDVTERSGFYRDDGLQELTRYYYHVAMVDSSGVEGPLSDIVSASTAPPELGTAFPVPVKAEVAGALAVGDVRGDGSLIIAVGSDLLYTIDSLGGELLDGDADSQTLGPLAGAGGAFSPAGVSMAQLDANPGLEILGSSWGTREIYIVDKNGDNLPGWPQLMNAKAWGTPSVADLDNDGDLEIVVNDTGGRTYAWHHDGSELADGDNDPGTHGVLQIRSGESFNRSTIALFDVNNDGNKELLFGTNYGAATNYFHALQTDGTDAPGWPKDLGVSGRNVTSATVADLDRDGVAEIMFISENNTFHVFQPDGSDKPGWPIAFESDALDSGSKAPSVAVGNFDSDLDLEMVAVSVRNATESWVFIMDHDGTVLPGWPQFLEGLSEGSPIIGDLNGDYSADVVFGIGGGADGAPNVLAAFNADGSAVEGFPLTLSGPARGTPAIVDFDKDGDVELVYCSFDRNIHVWDMPFDHHPGLAYWPSYQANNQRTGVYGELHETGTDPGATGTPLRQTVLHQNVPNPFNPSTSIRFEIPTELSGETARLDIFDLAGRRVNTLLNRGLPSGTHEAVWRGKDEAGRRVASGVYFARLRVGSQSQTLKMTLAK